MNFISAVVGVTVLVGKPPGTEGNKPLLIRSRDVVVQIGQAWAVKRVEGKDVNKLLRVGVINNFAQYRSDKIGRTGVLHERSILEAIAN